MSELPILSGKGIIKALVKLGYKVVRQRGSLIRLYCPGKKPITVPNYKAIIVRYFTKFYVMHRSIMKSF